MYNVLLNRDGLMLTLETEEMEETAVEEGLESQAWPPSFECPGTDGSGLALGIPASVCQSSGTTAGGLKSS